MALQVIWNYFKVLITECKKPQLQAAEGQALAQTAAAREEYVRENVTGVKRKRSDIDDVLPVCPFRYFPFATFVPDSLPVSVLHQSFLV